MTSPGWIVEQPYEGLTAYVIPAKRRPDGARIILATCHAIGKLDPLGFAQAVCDLANQWGIPSSECSI